MSGEAFWLIATAVGTVIILAAVGAFLYRRLRPRD